MRAVNNGHKNRERNRKIGGWMGGEPGADNRKKEWP